MTPALVIIIPDTTPLIHLAAGNLLGVLPAMGHVVVPDVVALEATRLPDKPWAAEIAAWLDDPSVEVAETELGVFYRLAMLQHLRPPRHAGELSIVEWLRDGLPERAGSALVIYEDPRVPKMVAQEDLSREVATMTTRSFLELAEQRGIIPSADQAWRRIETVVPNANPAIARTVRKPAP